MNRHVLKHGCTQLGWWGKKDPLWKKKLCQWKCNKTQKECTPIQALKLLPSRFSICVHLFNLLEAATKMYEPVVLLRAAWCSRTCRHRLRTLRPGRVLSECRWPRKAGQRTGVEQASLAELLEAFEVWKVESWFA